MNKMDDFTVHMKKYYILIGITILCTGVLTLFLFGITNIVVIVNAIIMIIFGTSYSLGSMLLIPNKEDMLKKEMEMMRYEKNKY